MCARATGVASAGLLLVLLFPIFAVRSIFKKLRNLARGRAPVPPRLPNRGQRDFPGEFAFSHAIEGYEKLIDSTSAMRGA